MEIYFLLSPANTTSSQERMIALKRFITLFLTLVLLSVPLITLGETVTTTDATPEELLQQWYTIGELLRENGNYPYVALSKGDSGYEVVALQTRLTELGYYQKEIVDVFGNGTYSAMRAFEKANGLSVNGVASVEDQQVLFSDAAVVYTEQKSPSSSNRNDAPANANASDATSSATK